MKIDPTPSPEQIYNAAVEAVQLLKNAGYAALWAGGCVRDQIMGATPKDYDIVTDATPEQTLELFPHSIGIGKAFGVIKALVNGIYFEIATFRQDKGYSDGRHPDRVTFVDEQSDAARRDFTINAILYDPLKELYHDHVNGRADIDASIIRCVGIPADRFREDHLRMLRAVRFANTLGFQIHQDTADAIRQNAHLASGLSAERIQQELTRLFTETKKPGDALLMLHDLGLLQVILPEVAAMKGQEQPPEFHPEGDVFAHTVIMLNMLAAPSSQLIFATIFHDVGKPATAVQASDRIRFNGHASKGADMTEEIMRRLRFSSADTETVSYCVRNHMRFIDVQRMRPSTLRKLVGAPTFPIELELHRLDCRASHGDISNYEFLVEFQEKIAAEPVLPPPWLAGRDIIALGVEEGPEIGRLLQKAYDAQLDSKFENRTVLLQWIQGLLDG